jgi:hypothetical protein
MDASLRVDTKPPKEGEGVRVSWRQAMTPVPHYGAELQVLWEEGKRSYQNTGMLAPAQDSGWRAGLTVSPLEAALELCSQIPFTGHLIILGLSVSHLLVMSVVLWLIGNKLSISTR